MRRALVAIAAALGLVLGVAAPAEAVLIVRGTRPVYYLGPAWGWPAWCGQLGWGINWPAGGSPQVTVAVGSSTDDGSGACGYHPPVATAAVSASVRFHLHGQVEGCAVHTVHAGIPSTHWRSGAAQCPGLIPGTYTVTVAASWDLSNGAHLGYSATIWAELYPG